MNDTPVVTLTESESSEFLRLDEVISTGAKTFMAVGQALVKMHKGRLYRQFGTFEAYCVSRGIKRRAAYRLMESVQVTLELEECADLHTPSALANIEVLKNSSAEAAVKLSCAPESKRLEILEAAVVASDGGPLTGAAIEKATAEVTHKAGPPMSALLVAQDGGCPPEHRKPAMTLNRWVKELALMENEVNHVCDGNQKERAKFGAIANALANRLMNPPSTTSCYTR